MIRLEMRGMDEVAVLVDGKLKAVIHPEGPRAIRIVAGSGTLAKAPSSCGDGKTTIMRFEFREERRQ